VNEADLLANGIGGLSTAALAVLYLRGILRRQERNIRALARSVRRIEHQLKLPPDPVAEVLDVDTSPISLVDDG